LLANEIIGKALRNQRAYPEISIRELTANCIIHQNFEEKGFPMIEIYSDRVAIFNPGQPLIVPERFIDEYVSRNEKMADLMRRANACYQHCCLRYMQNEKMTNQSLRERFEVEEKNYPMVSRIIKETIEVGFIKEEDPENRDKRYSKYLPFWG
jgi:predicted HTH transcriptional regulator